MKPQDTAAAALPYARRIAEDRNIQSQLWDAADSARSAAQRIVSKGVQSAASDSKIQGDIKDAVTSVRSALVAIEQPARKRRRGRALLLLAAAGAAGYALIQRSS
ncbi:MAG TPA: hypothetical protein VH025_11250 [Solirubrobacteraceae bacterium]|jgi:hypothetical protein|nr:hypothetical protein [Solirubrobacteraceae bacterium]